MCSLPRIRVLNFLLTGGFIAGPSWRTRSSGTHWTSGKMALYLWLHYTSYPFLTHNIWHFENACRGLCDKMQGPELPRALGSIIQCILESSHPGGLASGCPYLATNHQPHSHSCCLRYSVVWSMVLPRRQSGSGFPKCFSDA